MSEISVNTIGGMDAFKQVQWRNLYEIEWSVLNSLTKNIVIKKQFKVIINKSHKRWGNTYIQECNLILPIIFHQQKILEKLH